MSLKYSEANPASPLDGTELIGITQAGNDVRSTTQAIADLAPVPPPGLANNAFATRALMASYAPPVLNVDDNFFLSEEGREGWFVVDPAASWTAQIAADTGQVIFVPSTFDATKVYRRVEKNSISTTHGGALLNNTDEHVKILSVFSTAKALAGIGGGAGFYKGGPGIVSAAGKMGYMGSNVIEVDYTGLLTGFGSGRHGPLGHGASALRFSSSGIRVQHPNTAGAVGVTGDHDGSGGFGINNHMFQGPEDGTEVSDGNLFLTDIGLDVRKQVTLNDTYWRGFRGITIKSICGTYDGTNYSGDGSLSFFQNTKTESGRFGYFFAGSDTNITVFINTEAYLHTQCGYYFDVGIGPVLLFGSHNAANGLVAGFLSYKCHYNGRIFAAVPNTSTAALTANAPPNSATNNTWWYFIETGVADTIVKTWDGVQAFRWGGDIITQGKVNPNQVALIMGGYSENPGICFGGPATLWVNCVIAAKYRKGGVHVYAVQNVLHCDENVDFGANLAARGAVHTLGDNAGSSATALNIDAGASDAGIYFRGPGATGWGYFDFLPVGCFANCGASSGWNFRIAGTAALIVLANSVAPGSDNTLNLGTSSNRWKEVFAANNVINTSDKRLKTNINKIDDKVLDAWAEVKWEQFQLKTSVKVKGKDGARLHTGLIAQQIENVFKKYGLDGFRYGLLCFDKWDDEFEPEFEIVEREEEVKIPVDPVYEGFDWVRKDDDKRAEMRHGKPGKWFKQHKLSEEQRLGYRLEKQIVEVHIPKLDKSGKQVHKLRLKAGELFGVRYEQALAMEAALMRRTTEKLEKRLAALEKAAG